MSHVRTLIRLSLILLIVQSALCQWKPKNPNKETLCTTNECQARGEEYTKNLDTAADPCEDFYTFTCGNWSKNHKSPRFDSEWTMVDVMFWKFVSTIKNALETYPILSDDTSIVRQTKQVYETCHKIPRYRISDAANVKQEIERIGKFPEVPLWELHNNYFKLSGESAFFAVKIVGSSPSERIPAIMFTEPTSAYGAIWHEEEWKPLEKRNYMDYLLLLMKSLDFNVPDNVIKERIKTVLEFRENLTRIINQSSDMRPDRFDPYTRQQLKQWLAHYSRAMRKTQRIPWSEVIDVVVDNLYPEAKPEQRVITVRQKQYFIYLTDLLNDTPNEVIANHIEIHFIERNLRWDKYMMQLLERTSLEPYDRLNYIRQRYFKRWQLCIKNHNIPEILDGMVYETSFPKESIGIVKEMIHNIKGAIDDQMKNSNWMNEGTRTETMRRINSLEQWIGFPIWYYEQLELPRKRNEEGILSPRPSLNIDKNLFYIHAPLMFSPIFDPQVPALYNYAGLGATIGHGLYHMMNNCGSYESDNSEIFWWRPDMRKLCLPKMNAFVPVYNKITDREFRNHYYEILESNTSFTLNENFPDVMGLEAAYNAYKQLTNQNQTNCQVLPGFEEYSCEQMFYIAFGNTFCGTHSKKAALRKLYRSAYSIGSVRVNGAVAQMESFGRAFECPVGSLMNPEKKVNLWR